VILSKSEETESGGEHARMGEYGNGFRGGGQRVRRRIDNRQQIRRAEGISSHDSTQDGNVA
jgi:hypothetical protein